MFFLILLLLVAIFFVFLTSCQVPFSSTPTSNEYDMLLLQVETLTQLIADLTEEIHQLSVKHENLVIENARLMTSNRRLEKIIDHGGTAQQIPVINYITSMRGT